MIWKFYIEDGSYSQTEIPNPVGWADAVFKFRRDRDLHGVFFDYSVPLKFHGTGYDMIKAAYDADGVEAYLRMIIEVQCVPTDAFEEFYTAKLNFSKIQFLESDVCFVEMVLEDDSCLSMFNNRQDQEIELQSVTTLDGQTMEDYEWIGKQVSLPPKAINKTDGLFHSDDSDLVTIELDDLGDAEGTLNFIDYIWLNPPEIVNEFGGMNEEYENGAAYGTSTIPDIWENPHVLYADANIEVDGRFHTSLHIEVTLINATLVGGGPGETFEDVTVELICRRTEPDTTETNTTLATQTFSGFHTNSFTEDLDFDYSLFPAILTNTNLGDRYTVYLKITTSGTYAKIIPGDPINVVLELFLTDTADSFIQFQVVTRYPATDARVSMVNESFARIVESITNKCLTVKSDYFGRTDSQPYVSADDGCGSLEAITSGALIRRMTDASHKISFKKLFDGLNAIHNIGVGIETDTDRTGYDRIRIERAEYFYNDTFIMNCDKVPDIKRTVITDEHYSIYEFGYQKWEAEEYNGLDEFNTTRKYRTSLTSIKNTLSKISSLIASGYAIEITRQQFLAPSKDWRYDNDDFIICLKRFGYGDDMIVEQGNIDTPANLIDPDTVYNFRISPNRNALRHLQKVLASYVDPAIAGSLFFMSGTGNTSAEGLLEDGCVYETGVLSEQEQEINIATLSDDNNGLPIYVLQLWEFEYPLTFAEYQAIRANPMGVISVRYGQQEDFHDCYIRQIEYKPNQGLANFQLLPSYPFTTTDFILQENGDYLLQEDGFRLRQD